MMEDQDFCDFNPAYGDAETLPLYEKEKFVIVRRHGICGVHSDYYVVNAQVIVAECSEIAGAFDLRNWFNEHFPEGPDGVPYRYIVMRTGE